MIFYFYLLYIHYFYLLLSSQLPSISQSLLILMTSQKIIVISITVNVIVITIHLYFSLSFMSSLLFLLMKSLF
jgi:hypothetical protein